MDKDVICWRCGRTAYEHCYSPAGRKEVGISGLCEECFDTITAEPDDEDNMEDEEA